MDTHVVDYELGKIPYVVGFATALEATQACAIIKHHSAFKSLCVTVETDSDIPVITVAELAECLYGTKKA